MSAGVWSHQHKVRLEDHTAVADALVQVNMMGPVRPDVWHHTLQCRQCFAKDCCCRRSRVLHVGHICFAVECGFPLENSKIHMQVTQSSSQASATAVWSSRACLGCILHGTS